MYMYMYMYVTRFSTAASLKLARATVYAFRVVDVLFNRCMLVLMREQLQLHIHVHVHELQYV